MYFVMSCHVMCVDMRALGRNQRGGGQTQTNGTRSASGCIKNVAMMCAHVPVLLMYATYLVMVEIPVALLWYLLRMCVGPRVNEVGDCDSCGNKSGSTAGDNNFVSTNRPLSEEAIVHDDVNDVI
jgi:hypothetical protein